jgi:hypothetical protein
VTGLRPDENPERLYIVTGGRSRPDSDAFDLVTLVVAESAPAPGMPSEHTAILRLCTAPTAVVEIAAELRLPVGVTTILLSDLLHAGRITVRHPRPMSTGSPGSQRDRAADTATLEKVLFGLRKL